MAFLRRTLQDFQYSDVLKMQDNEEYEFGEGSGESEEEWDSSEEKEVMELVDN